MDPNGMSSLFQMSTGLIHDDTSVVETQTDGESNNRYSKYSHSQTANDYSNSDLYDDYTFLQYDTPEMLPKPEKCHFSFANSAFFRIRKSEAEFSYMKRHGEYQCSENPKPKQEIPKILDLIKPPQKFEVDGALWCQRLSPAISDCNDAYALEDKLDELLVTRKARNQGICPIRRSLYDDCFDELHRQIALKSPERAILLVRCRREIEATISAWTGLMGSIHAYNMRHSILQTDGYQDFQDKREKLLEDKINTLDEYNSLTIELLQTQARNDEDEAVIRRKQSEELEYLKSENSRLKNQQNTFMTAFQVKKLKKDDKKVPSALNMTTTEAPENVAPAEGAPATDQQR